jgi:hypothetical protein
MTVTVVAIRLVIPSWFRDHCFDGRVILPAVEAMCLLAKTVHARYPAVNVGVMEKAVFSKFLEIAPEQDEIEIRIEFSAAEDGRVLARLLTRKQLKVMTQWVRHCELSFGGSPGCGVLPEMEAGDIQVVVEVPAERIYRELVPFGPAYRTLQGDVSLREDMALGRLRTPYLPLAFPPLGSPFCLDGAMHAACVHAQQSVDFVPFPVGFAARIIAAPTSPGQEYGVKAYLRSSVNGELVYDLLILDQDKRPRETILGLRMRDVSNGRIKPPSWIRAITGK